MQLTQFVPLVRLYNWWHGTRIIRSGSGHRIETGNARLRHTRIELYGRDARVKFGRDVRLFDCNIILRGTAPCLRIGADTRLRNVRIVVEDCGSHLSIGHSTSMTGARLQVMEGGGMEIGADCMLGNGVEVNNSDSHSLLDAASGQRLNPARDVVLGDHVWLGAGVWVAKGSHIGAGSVVAARSRVDGMLPAGVLAAGSPAVVKRTGVTWDRQRFGVKS